MTKRDQEIVRSYRAGLSSGAIGRLLGITGRRVIQILEANGVERRRPRPPRLMLHLTRRRAA